MEKHKKLLRFLKRLEKKMDFSSIHYVDYWDVDLLAVGFRKEDKLVYLCIDLDSKKSKRYSCDFEHVDDSIEDYYNVLKEIRNVSEAEIVEEIRQFLF